MGGFLIGKLIGMAGISKSGLTITVSGYRQLLTDLRKIEPGLNTEMRREIRKIGNPLRDAVKSSIPAQAPIRGMRPSADPVGRLSWGAGKPAKTAVLDTKKPKRSFKGTALVRIVVSSPATVMSDMAGRSRRYIGKRPYAAGTKANSMIITGGKYKGDLGYAYRYPNGVISGRKHRNTGGQGSGMIRGLSSKPSRYVYPAVEKALPATKVQIGRIISSYAYKFNRG
jgi:hypothetical protein